MTNITTDYQVWKNHCATEVNNNLNFVKKVVQPVEMVEVTMYNEDLEPYIAMAPKTVKWDENDIENFYEEIKGRVVPLVKGFMLSSAAISENGEELLAKTFKAQSIDEIVEEITNSSKDCYLRSVYPVSVYFENDYVTRYLIKIAAV